MAIIGRTPLCHDGDSLTAADPHGAKAAAPACPGKLVNQFDRNDRTRCANRMAEGNCTAIGVHAVCRKPKLTQHRTGLRRKGLVRFNDIEIGHRQPGLQATLRARGVMPRVLAVAAPSGPEPRLHPSCRLRYRRSLGRPCEKPGAVWQGRLRSLPRGHVRRFQRPLRRGPFFTIIGRI